jgi:hypothetical protein
MHYASAWLAAVVPKGSPKIDVVPDGGEEAGDKLIQNRGEGGVDDVICFRDVDYLPWIVFST